MEFFKANIVPAEVLVQLIAFVIVFWTLKLLAWKPLLQSLAARREKIQGEFDRIDAARKEIDQLKSEYQGHLQRIDEESRARLQEAVEEGRRISRELQDKARQDAQGLFDQTKDNLNLEAEKIRMQLRNEIAVLAVQVSEKILKEKLNDQVQQEKIRAMIEELDSSLESPGGR